MSAVEEEDCLPLLLRSRGHTPPAPLSDPGHCLKPTSTQILLGILRVLEQRRERQAAVPRKIQGYRVSASTTSCQEPMRGVDGQDLGPRSVLLTAICPVPSSSLSQRGQ